MKYYLYIDESGDHGLATVNPDFPVFLLCGVLVSADEDLKIQQSINNIKQTFWNGKHVILHSRDIRKCEKEFSILFDLELKKVFYEKINAVIQGQQYTVIASAIKKESYIKQYGRLTTNNVYELALSFIIERAIFFVDDIRGTHEIEIIIEKRGRREDKKLGEHFQRLMARGTNYVSAKRLKNYKMKITFMSKRENVIGLQLSDLVAYPIARYVIDPARANPAFDQVEPKIYHKGAKRYGLKLFP